MANLNRVQLIGRLARDPEVRYIPSGAQVVSFSMAVDRVWKGQDGERKQATEWFQLEAWGRLGEICQQYLKKGSLAYVEGELRNDQWVDDKGEKRSRTKINNNAFKLLDPRRHDEPPPPPLEEPAIVEPF